MMLTENFSVEENKNQIYLDTICSNQLKQNDELLIKPILKVHKRHPPKKNIEKLQRSHIHNSLENLNHHKKKLSSITFETTTTEQNNTTIEKPKKSSIKKCNSSVGEEEKKFSHKKFPKKEEKTEIHSMIYRFNVWEKRKEDKREKLRKQIEKKEKEEFKFKPKLNTLSSVDYLNHLNKNERIKENKNKRCGHEKEKEKEENEFIDRKLKQRKKIRELNRKLSLLFGWEKENTICEEKKREIKKRDLTINTSKPTINKESKKVSRNISNLGFTCSTISSPVYETLTFRNHSKSKQNERNKLMLTSDINILIRNMKNKLEKKTIKESMFNMPDGVYRKKLVKCDFNKKH